MHLLNFRGSGRLHRACGSSTRTWCGPCARLVTSVITIIYSAASLRMTRPPGVSWSRPDLARNPDGTACSYNNSLSARQKRYGDPEDWECSALLARPYARKARQKGVVVPAPRYRRYTTPAHYILCCRLAIPFPTWYMWSMTHRWTRGKARLMSPPSDSPSQRQADMARATHTHPKHNPLGIPEGGSDK